MSKEKFQITEEELELIAQTHGKRPSDKLTKLVMDHIDQVEKAIQQGVEPPTREKERPTPRRSPGGRDSIS